MILMLYKWLDHSQAQTPARQHGPWLQMGQDGCAGVVMLSVRSDLFSLSPFAVIILCVLLM